MKWRLATAEEKSACLDAASESDRIECAGMSMSIGIPDGREEYTHLSAASHDMLEALRAIVKWADQFSVVDSHGSEDTGSWLSNEGYAVIDKARAAIAKAEGA